MGEGHIQKFVRSLQTRIIITLVLSGLFLLAGGFLASNYTSLEPAFIALIMFVVWFCITIPVGLLIGSVLAKPMQYTAQAILHVAPSEHLTTAPNLENLHFGRELVNNLTRLVYDYAADTGQESDHVESTDLLDQLPIAIIGLDESGTITLANQKANSITRNDTLTGHQMQHTLKLLTDDEISPESWIKAAGENSLTATQSWQKVALEDNNGNPLGYFDIAVSFNKKSASGIETILSLYDHSDAYEDEDDSISFIALAVHELRTPLTILRGYVEAFQDEIGSQATPQITDDLKKMNASAEGLSSFVSNILNVARINQGQLSLKLTEANWNEVLPKIVDSLRSRTDVYGKKIELRMQANMPSVAIDRMTIGEVITNLVDNAIKYTPDDQPLIQIISQVNAEGLIEVNVIDNGFGIPGSVMPKLFTKFSRNHRNKDSIGGTGLGLFLSKAIVTAHQGHIWASSKENEGSTFSFSLLPYSQLAAEHQSTETDGIVRGQHGWIKNHSMQRR